MGKIATWAYINSKTEMHEGPAAKCPTRRDIVVTSNAGVNGSYGSSQCVQEEHIYMVGLPYNNIYFERRGSDSVVYFSMDYMPQSETGVRIEYFNGNRDLVVYTALLPPGLQSSGISLSDGITTLKGVTITSGSEDNYYRYRIIIKDR